MEEYERYLSRADELHQTETNDIEMTTNSSSKNRAPSSPDIREQVKKKRIRLRLPPLGRLRRRKAIAQMDDARGTLFGRSVADLFQGETLNPQLMWLLKILHEQGPSASGIFRRTSNINACRKIKSQMENGAECEQINVYMASNVLKEVLRSLSDCVLCCDKYDQWLECPLSKEHLKRMVYGLPFHNRHLLRHLICVLHAIQRSVAVSMMSSHSLAICFGPSLLWSRRTSAAASSAAALEGQKAADVSRIVANVGRVIGVVEALIDNAEAVFGADCLRLLQGTTAADQNVMTKTADDDREYLDQTVVCREKNPANSSSTERVSLPPGGNSERPVAPPRHKRAKSLRTAADKTARLGLPADYSNHRMKTEELPGFDDQLTSIDSEMSWSELRDQLAESTDDALDDSASYEEISVTEEELDDREGDGGPKRSSMFSCRSEELGHQGGVVEDRFSLRLGRSVSVDYVETASKRQPTKRPEATMDRGRTTLGGFTRRINALLATTNEAPVGREFSSSSDHLKSLGAESSGDVLSTETSEARRNRRPSYKSFSSTDELLLDGHRLVSGDGRVFFSGNSFSSTAGSDADLSTFGESMDGESAFARLNFLSGLENRKSYDDEKSGSSVVVSGSKLKSGGGETRTVPKITIDVAVDSASRDQARDSVERGPTDVIEVTGESRDSIREAKVVGGDVHQRVIYRTDAGDDDVRQHPGISSRSSSVSRSVPETKQRRGMTGSGSDVFPSHLSKTYRLKKAHLCSSDALDYDSASGTESGVDAGGTGGGGGSSSNWRLRPPRGSGKAVVEERMVESDLERVADRRWEETNQRNSEPIDTLRQWDSDTGEQRSARRNSIEKKADLPRNPGESSRKETPSTVDYLSAALQGEESKRENSKAEEAAKVRTETVRSDSPKTAASQVTRSCSDLPKTLDLYLVTSRRSEEQDQLRHHSSVGSIADSALQKKLHPRRLRHLISTSDSDSSDESGKRADDGGQTRRKRRRNRRPRRSRGSDPRIQTVRTNNRVNLVRSKSDSNALCRTELIIKKESNCALEDGQGKTGIFTKYTADLANINVSKDDNNNNNKQNGRAVKVGGPDLEVGTQNKENELNLAELLSTEPGTRCRRQVTMKDRSWHQELVEELSSSKNPPPRQTQSSSGSQGGKAAKQAHSKGIGLHENKSNVSKTSSNATASQPTDEPTTGTRSNQGTGARMEGPRATGNTVGRLSEGAIEAKADGKFRGGGGDWDSNSAADGRKVSALERNRRAFGKSVDNLHASSSSLVRISRTANEAEDLYDGGADLSKPDTRHFSGNKRRAHSFKTIAGELSAASHHPASHGANPNAADDLKKVETDSGEFSLRTVESIKRSLMSGRPSDQNRPRHSGSISRPPQKPRPTTDTESRNPGNNNETSRLENSKSLNRSVSLTAHRTPGPSHLYVYDQLKSESNTKAQTSERRDSELRDYSKDSSNLRKHIAGEIRSPKDAKNTWDSRNAQPSVSKIAGNPSFLSPETHRPRGIQPTPNKPSPFASAMSIDDPREENRFTSSNSVVSGDARGDTSSDDCSSSSGSPSSTRADRGARRAASRSAVGNPGKSEMPWSVASIRSYFGGQDSV